MKTIRITMVIAALALAWNLSAGQSEVNNANCVKVADIKAGNKVNTGSEEIVRSQILAETQKTDADKVVVKMVRKDHGKLGARYYAKAVALKCEN